MKPTWTGDLFPDAAAIQAALERRTRDALVRRLGAPNLGSPNLGAPNRPNEATAARPAGTSGESQATADPRRRAKGIGFSLELVRALFDGRKSQTRRLIRPLPATPPRDDACPLGRAGDWLYVREPYLPVAGDGPRYAYAVDATPADGRRFRPAMAMPRDAARLWLRIDGVRVERLQSITPADLAAEGLSPGQRLAGVWDGFYTGPGERWADDPWVWAIAFAVAPRVGVSVR